MNKILLLILFPFACFGQTKDFKLEEARRHITVTYGDQVYLKAKGLSKFGYNPDIDGTRETVQEQGREETSFMPLETLLIVWYHQIVVILKL